MSNLTPCLQTSMGRIEIELYWDHAPKTCKNFLELCKRGYYSGTIFHRVIAGFMIQGRVDHGQRKPLLKSHVKVEIRQALAEAARYGDRFEDEINPELRFVGAGILAMANNGPNSNGSQYFITLAPCPHLDRKHTIFGRVLSGMRVVERLAAVEVDSSDRPKDQVTVLKSTAYQIADDDPLADEEVEQ